MKSIIISDIDHYNDLYEYFSGYLIDIVYLDRLDDTTAEVVPDVGVNMNKEDDIVWLQGLIREALKESNNINAKIEMR